MAATGEYSAKHGGTVPGALRGIVTTVSRVSGIYTRKRGIGLQLVADNDKLVFTDPLHDPFTAAGGRVTAGPVRVTWDVAGTRHPPVDSQAVNILLSTDGGSRFVPLLSNTPNDGEEEVTLPATSPPAATSWWRAPTTSSSPSRRGSS